MPDARETPQGQVGIKLDDLTVDDVPAPLDYHLLDRLEQGRAFIFDPLVNLGFTAREMKVWVFSQTVDGRLAGRQRFGAAFRPTPQPNRVRWALAIVCTVIGIVASKNWIDQSWPFSVWRTWMTCPSPSSKIIWAYSSMIGSWVAIKMVIPSLITM